MTSDLTDLTFEYRTRFVEMADINVSEIKITGREIMWARVGEVILIKAHETF